MFRTFLILSLVLIPFTNAFSEEQAPEKEPEKKSQSKKETPPPVSKDGSVTIDGVEIPYTVTTSKTLLEDDKGDGIASIFSISYVKRDIEDAEERPVMFAFNGGPGSSSVWLHLGILGPKRINFEGDGTIPITPPARLIENEFSLLDKCDLVFIDPVSTGYSRAEGKNKERDFHGLESDISSVGDFIRIWITENKRWASPKYLCGESYGGVRAAGLAKHLQDEFGMSMNGVVLLSSLLDFRTIVSSQGSLLSDQVFLPAYATTALHHGKISGDRDKILEAAKNFAFGGYAVALLKGADIGEDEKTRIAERLGELTGISADIWKRENLRIHPFEFRAELLRDEGKVIGRFDSRVAWDANDTTAEYAEYDPSYSLALGAFSTAMLSYLGNDLGWIEKQPYEVLTSVGPWDYGSGNKITNVTDRLEDALRDNPKMKVLVMGAYTDLATPPEGMEYSFRQASGFSKAIRKNISFKYYDAGHMFYLNPSDLKKARIDLVEFLEAE